MATYLGEGLYLSSVSSCSLSGQESQGSMSRLFKLSVGHGGLEEERKARKSALASPSRLKILIPQALSPPQTLQLFFCPLCAPRPIPTAPILRVLLVYPHHQMLVEDVPQVVMQRVDFSEVKCK